VAARDQVRRLSTVRPPRRRGIRLLTRNDYDWADRYPLIRQAVNELRCRSCLIDGEIVCCDENGIQVFQKLRYRRGDSAAFLYAFDLLNLDGKDLRREPLESRKAKLTRLLRNAGPGVRVERAHGRRRRNDLPSCLQDGWSRRNRVEAPQLALRVRTIAHWIKMKNPNAPAVKREAEEDWG
jgi:ATP-dependent DNA ligase